MNEIDKHLHTSVRDGIVIIELLDRRIVDTGHIKALNIALDRIVTNHPTASLVLVFDRVENLSSSMLSVLIALAGRLRQLGCELRLAGVSDELRIIFKMSKLDRKPRLAGVSDELRIIFKMTKLDRVLALDDDVETALSHLPRPHTRSA